MSTPTGAQGKLGIRRESSFASGGAIESWQPFVSETISSSHNNIYPDQVRDTAEQVYGLIGNESAGGNVTFLVSPQNPTQWWQCALGQVTSPYYFERPIKSMIVQIDRETAAIQVSGAVVNTMTLSSAQGGILTCSADLEAAGSGSVSAGTATYTENDAPYLHSEAVFSLNGTDDTSVTAFSVTINNNASTDLYGTTRYRIDIPAGKLAVTGSFTKLFDDTTERNAFLNAQVRSFKATFARQGANFVVWMPKIRYDSRPANISSQTSYILETFNFTAFVDNPTTEKSIYISGDNIL